MIYSCDLILLDIGYIFPIYRKLLQIEEIQVVLLSSIRGVTGVKTRVCNDVVYCQKEVGQLR